MITIYKTYFRCDDSLVVGKFEKEFFLPKVNSFTFNGLVTDLGYTTAPAWFTQVNAFPLHDIFWLMTPPEDGVTYRFSWTANNSDNTTDEYIVELIQLSNCNTNITVKNCNDTLLAWLNREGGWSYFYFTGKTTYSVTIPEGKTWIRDNVIRYFDRSKVYRGELLTTDSIPQDALDLIESLKYSVQVYKVDFSDIQFIKLIPVLLEDGDYTKRKTGEKIFDVSVKIIYAEEVVIQGQ